MQHTLTRSRFPCGSMPQLSPQVKGAGLLWGFTRLVLIVFKALVTAVIAHRRYELHRSKGIDHDKAIRRALLSDVHD